ncbi:hypothetical protein IFR04_016244 [Cadophora malorum]|uniref:Uncharacterized protein n=1 Tax=Cadophora malorum TaxID=108018 RepID=A0A8H7W4I3_9HELO|nr:hypothetical protein IFR04_016244 [Cadophora malorum]
MAIMERILIFTINIFCPPISVLLVAGPGMDCLINTLFFIAGVIPGHIHGFYVTCTYFHRKHKVKRGRYPGGRKTGIYSEENKSRPKLQYATSTDILMPKQKPSQTPDSLRPPNRIMADSKRRNRNEKKIERGFVTP